jgi:hypothetical protein
MIRRSYSVWRVFGVAALLCMSTALSSHGATVILQAFVSFAINDNGNVNPLADGSIVYLFGTDSGTVEDPLEDGNGDLIAQSVQGDNVFLATITIGEGIFSAGTGLFAVAVEVPDNIEYFYIRFFDTDVHPVQGTDIYWGESDAIQRQFIIDGMYQADFNPDDDLYTDQQDNFVVIPEPGTMQLVLLAGFVVVFLSMKLKRKNAVRSEVAL